MLTRASSLPHGCHSLVRDRVYSPVIGVEALMFSFDQPTLPSHACPASTEVIAEASEPRVVMVNLCISCVSIHGYSQKQRKIISLSQLCLPQI